MTVITVDTTSHTPTAPAGPVEPGSPLWIQPRPNLTRSATLAGDLLGAMGKRRDLHGKGRNTHQDIALAIAWMRATNTRDLVIIDSQTLPPPLLITLRRIAGAAEATLWLLHRPPIDDPTHITLTRIATRTGKLGDLPPAAPLTPAVPQPHAGPAPTAPRVDFTSYLNQLIHDGNSELLSHFQTQFNTTQERLVAATEPVGVISDAIADLLGDAPSDDLLIPGIRAIQVAAWHHDLYVAVDLERVLASEERPRHTPADADPLLLAYRQPHRALVVGLTLRRIGLHDIATITLNDVSPTGGITVAERTHTLTPALRIAALAQHHLRHAQAADPADPLIPLAIKTMATRVTDAAHDLGIQTAGRRVERRHTTDRWLAALGITITAMP